MSEQVILIAMAYVRLGPVFYLFPFFNERILTGLIFKNVLIYAVMLGMWPVISPMTSVLENTTILLVISGELFVGLVLAFVVCTPFWIANNIGELIDNQRGATISDTIDPANGVETSILGAFMNFFCGAIFLLSGGMLLLLQTIAASYQHVPFGTFVAHFNWYAAGEWVNNLVGRSLVLSAPVLVIMFLCEIALGVYSRFCPQLNAFSLSLTIKSIIAFSVLIVYFTTGLPDELIALFDINNFYLMMGS